MIPQLNPVRPGDLITSQQMNLLILAIQDVDQRLRLVEANGGGGGPSTPATPPTISSFEPALSSPLGQIVTVRGTRFAFPAANNQVTIAGQAVPAANFQSDSTSIALRFIVPTTITVPAGGGSLQTTIRITNSFGSTEAGYALTAPIAAGTPPSIAGIQPAAPDAFITTGAGTHRLLINGANLRGASLAETTVSFVLRSLNPEVTYPGPEHPLPVIIDTGSTADQLSVVIPNFVEFVRIGVPLPVDVKVKVGQLPEATRQVSIIRLS